TIYCPFIYNSFTTILFSVIVPVLSVQITDVQPNVSTDDSLRTKTFLRNIRCTPKDKVTVTIAGSPSGMTATANDIPIKNISYIGFPSYNPINTVNIVKANTI